MSKVTSKPLRAILVFVATLGLLSSVTVVTNAQNSQSELFYSGPVITSPTFCENRSLGGPTTYAHDSDRDGVADVCSLRTTRRATIAIQNARELLAMEQANRGRFAQIFGFECTQVAQSYGEPAKEPSDECEAPRSAVARGERIPPVASDRLFPSVGQRSARFYSGPVITSATFCANRSLGGPTTYGLDTNGDGIADICSLPTTRRATIARQTALERFQLEVIRRPVSAGGGSFQKLLERECKALEGQTFAGDKASDLRVDECARGSGTSLPDSDNSSGTNSNNNSGTSNNNSSNNSGSNSNRGGTSISFPQATRPGAYSKRAAQGVTLASGDGQIVVRWDRVAADDNPNDNDNDPYDANDVFEYVVQYSTSSSLSNARQAVLQVVRQTGAVGTSNPAGVCQAGTGGKEYQCTLSQLTNNTRYYVRIEANRGLSNSSGTGTSSTRDYYTPTLSITPGIAGPPIWGDADSNKDGVQPLYSPGFGRITVAWGPPVEGVNTVLNYRLQWGTSSSLASNCNNSSSCEQQSFNTNTTSHTIEGLSNNRTYYVRVQAYSRNGPGTWTWTESLRLSARSLPNPGRPTNLVLSTVSQGTGLQVSWTAPVVTDNDPAPTEYHLQWRNTSRNQNWSAQTRQEVLNAGTTTYTIPNLAPLDRYEVRVLAVNLYSAGPWSATQRTTLGVAGIPHSITLLPGARSITANWVTPTSVPPAASIRIQWDTNSSFAQNCATDTSCQETSLAASATSYAISGLRSDTRYYVRLRTSNQNGPSAWSQAASIETGTPVPPTGVAAAEDADNIRQLDITWTYATETGKPAATGFRIQYRRVASSSWSSRSVSLAQADYDAPEGDTAGAYTLTGLTSGVEYEVRVLARNNYGDGQWSEPVKATPGSSFIPSSVILSQGTLSNDNVTITASWSPPSSSLTVNNYTVQWRTCGATGGSCGSWSSSRTTDADETNDAASAFRSSLRDDIYYQARVRANGASSAGGNGAYAESPKYLVEIDDNDTARDRTDDTITLTELS